MIHLMVLIMPCKEISIQNCIYGKMTELSKEGLSKILFFKMDFEKF